MICPYCASNSYSKHGFRYSESTGQRIARRYKCNDCGKLYSQSLVDGENNSFPRILLLDIETALMEVYVFHTHKQYIPPKQIKKDWCVLTWAAKWLYDDHIYWDALNPGEAHARNDKRIMKGMWELLDEADIIIGHNVAKFDDRKLKARFLKHKMMPPSPYRVIDTLRVAQREFALPSYKQAYLTEYFELTPKIDVSQYGGIELWKHCITGTPEAEQHLANMLTYNKQDVAGLEDLYLFLRPWIKGHPNIGLMMDETSCTNCGSPDLESTDKYYYTAASAFPVYRCANCRTPYIRHKKRIPSETNKRSIAS